MTMIGLFPDVSLSFFDHLDEKLIYFGAQRNVKMHDLI